MLLTQILQANCIRLPLEGRDKNDVIEELIDVLDRNGLLTDKDGATEAVYAREQTRSTGIGAGIAIPHAKCNAANDIVMAIGITQDPIDFDSIDGKPVNIVLLLISPKTQVGQHIQVLTSISRLMLDDEFKQAFEQAPTSEAAYQLLHDKENA